MRQDYHKVLTEDPRRGSDISFREYRRNKDNYFFDEEAVGGKQSLMLQRRIAGGDRKRFGDHLSPLKGWCRKQVGRLWDHAYGELCAAHKNRSFLHEHVHLHLFNDFVEVNTRMVDGKVCVRGWGGWENVEQSRNQFYVHPVTGILCSTYKEGAPGSAAEKAKRAKERFKDVFRAHDSHTHLFFEDGKWVMYFYKKKPAPQSQYNRPVSVSVEEWAAMSLADQERAGVRYWYVRPVRDVVPSIVYGYAFGRSSHAIPSDCYYYASTPANRKVLKKHGLLGTAEYKEDEGAISHRQMAKYTKK